MSLPLSAKAALGAAAFGALSAALARRSEAPWFWAGLGAAGGAFVGYNWKRIVVGAQAARATQPNPLLALRAAVEQE